MRGELFSVGVTRIRAVWALYDSQEWPGPVVRRWGRWLGVAVGLVLGCNLALVFVLGCDLALVVGGVGYGIPADMVSYAFVMVGMDAAGLLLVPVVVELVAVHDHLATVRAPVADDVAVPVRRVAEPVWRVLGPLPDDGNLRWWQVARSIRLAVDAGYLRAGDLLPGDRVLARHWRVSGTSVRRGKQTAVRQGYLVVRADGRCLAAERPAPAPAPQRGTAAAVAADG
ncbi:hypothetical protein [Dactylosporangium sp. CA-092794]|uniref:hypothetical protein n=1 Tax=Dactylosporangium sp. CA-092794 TaxID=3239929 RepID=UPI003D90E550